MTQLKWVGSIGRLGNIMGSNPHVMSAQAQSCEDILGIELLERLQTSIRTTRLLLGRTDRHTENDRSRNARVSDTLMLIG